MTDRGKAFGQALKQKRRAAEKTLGDVARHLEISVPYVSDVERGARHPWDEEKIRAVARYLGADAGELLAAAAETRGAFELDVSRGSPAQRDAGIALMRGWPELDDSGFQALKEFMENMKKKNGGAQ